MNQHGSTRSISVTAMIRTPKKRLSATEPLPGSIQVLDSIATPCRAAALVEPGRGSRKIRVRELESTESTESTSGVGDVDRNSWSGAVALPTSCDPSW